MNCHHAWFINFDRIRANILHCFEHFYFYFLSYVKNSMAMLIPIYTVPPPSQSDPKYQPLKRICFLPGRKLTPFFNLIRVTYFQQWKSQLHFQKHYASVKVLKGMLWAPRSLWRGSCAYWKMSEHRCHVFETQFYYHWITVSHEIPAYFAFLCVNPPNWSFVPQTTRTWALLIVVWILWNPKKNAKLLQYSCILLTFLAWKRISWIEWVPTCLIYC